MRKVFDNSMVAHVWAQQSQPEGRSGNGQFYFEGRTIYSYGRHFPAASFLTDDIVLINERRYSVSTARHLASIRGAVNHKKTFIVSQRVLEAVVNTWHDDDNRLKIKAAAKALEAETLKDVERLLNVAASKRVKTSQQKTINEAESVLTNAQAFYEAIGLKFPAALKKALEQITVGYAETLAKHKAALERKAKAEEVKKAARLKEASAIIARYLPAWRQRFPEGLSAEGMEEWRNALAVVGKVYMRIDHGAKEVETSKGARFPVDHAKKAFKVVRKVHESGIGFEPREKSIHLGNFKIDLIDTFGNVKAGCHFVEWDEIEALARELEIYP